MIEVHNLVKWYGPRLAVNNVSFTIPEGKIVGFLGPNGAGKTTTLRMITGYLPATSGRASIAGFDVFTQSVLARGKLGYLPESTPLYPEMRVEEYLHFRGKLQGMSRAQRKQRIGMVCEKCGLLPVQRRLIGQLSKGNKQRVGLAQALLHDPPVLILDEPTAGLDPNQITHFRALIAELRGKHTIILSTHILPEIERTADEVVIIAGGRIVASGTPAKLREKVGTGSRVIVDAKASADAMTRAIRSVDAVKAVEVTQDHEWTRALVTAKDDADVREAIGKVIASNGWPVREMRYETASLEQFFIEITAKQSTAGAA